MLFSWRITVTAGTAEDSPITETLKLTAGVMTLIQVRFEKGCKHLVMVKLLRAEHQILPANPGQWLTGDEETVVDEPYYELVVQPIDLKFLACSPSCTYDHDIAVRVLILPTGVVFWWQMLEKILRRMGLL
jgi:hypothetical protein